MAIKLFGSSISSIGKSFVSTVSKTVSKVSGGSSSKSTTSNSKSSSSGNKTSASSNSKSSSSGNKASASSNSKSSSSGNKTLVSSGSKQSTTTKYVTNAAAIYNASGKKVSTPSSVSTGRPAQSYATQAKSSTTNSQKSTGSSATVKTTTVKTTTVKITTAKAKTVTSTSVKSTSIKTPSSVSTGRPAQSYATQKKVSATSSQKTSGNSSSVKTTSEKAKTTAPTVSKTTNSKSPLSISSGRPEQSYSTQKKASTTYNQKTTDNSSKQAKLPVPVAQKAPLVTKTSKSKKEQSEASYSNNRPKQSYTHVVAYTPTASREGAGQMFYMSKTDPKGAKAGASFATSCIPYVGDAKDIQEAVTGKDLITGKKLTGGDRLLTIAAAGLPVVSGPMLKSVKNGSKIAVEEAPGMIKKAGTLIKKNAPEVKKVANKTDVAEDTAKAMKKKALKKVNDAKKPKEMNINESVSVNGKNVIRDNGTFDPDAIDKQGRTNTQRMEQGLAPIGKDGKSVNIHHIDQTDTGPVKEITATEHQKSYSVLHENTGQSPSNINRGEFNKWRKDYWEWRSNNLN